MIVWEGFGVGNVQGNAREGARCEGCEEVFGFNEVASAYIEEYCAFGKQSCERSERILSALVSI